MSGTDWAWIRTTRRSLVITLGDLDGIQEQMFRETGNRDVDSALTVATAGLRHAVTVLAELLP